MKRFWKFFQQNLFLLICSSIILVYIGYCIYSGRKAYIIASGSMEPVIPIGSIIFTKPEDQYYPGQVISFTRTIAEMFPENQVVGETINNNINNQEKIIVSHRIISVQNKNSEITYRTKGDANDKPDYNSINTANIIGRVFLTLPFIGYFFIMFQVSQYFRLYLVLLLIFVIISIL